MKYIAIIVLVIGVSSAYFLGKRSDDENYFENVSSCMEEIYSCTVPIRMLIEKYNPHDQTKVYLIRTGIRSYCPLVSKAVTCFKKAIASDSCKQIEAREKENYKPFFDNYLRVDQSICIEHLDAANENEYSNIMGCLLAVDACTEQIDRIIEYYDPHDYTLAYLRRTGIRSNCRNVSQEMTCFKKALVTDSCNQLAAPVKDHFKRLFDTFSEIYQGICIDHIEAIEANKACLFSDMTANVLNKCVDYWHASGDVCQIDDVSKISCLAPAFDACSSDVRGVAENIVELDRGLTCRFQP